VPAIDPDQLVWLQLFWGEHIRHRRLVFHIFRTDKGAPRAAEVRKRHQNRYNEASGANSTPAAL
jgi:hypothetical protein